MPRIVKEYRCAAHGEFEGTTPRCPACKHSKWVVQEFRTPVKVTSVQTKNSDKVVKQLAADFRMTDVKNDKAGGSVMDAMRRSPTTQSTWANVDPKAPPTQLGATGNALAGMPMPKMQPMYVARDPGEYRK